MIELIWFSAVSYWGVICGWSTFCLPLRCRRLAIGYEVTTAIEDWRSMNIGNYVQEFWRYLSVAATVAILLGAGVCVQKTISEFNSNRIG